MARERDRQHLVAALERRQHELPRAPRVGETMEAHQRRTGAAVADANPRTVVVLNTGDPVVMPWADRANAILQMWYPGQEGGAATADLLLGRGRPEAPKPPERRIVAPGDPIRPS